jgi:hypothetical protein
MIDRSSSQTQVVYSQSDLVPRLSFHENFIDKHSLIEIEFWDAYILNRASAAKFFTRYSYDEGPAEMSPFALGRIRYRFTSDVWFGEVKLFLIQHRIPVSIRFQDGAARQRDVRIEGDDSVNREG